MEIRRQMDALGASYHLMATLDDIAWTLNLWKQGMDFGQGKNKADIKLL